MGNDLSTVSVRDELLRLAMQHQFLQYDAENLAIGRYCIVLSNFNGQPFGKSRKPLTGECLKITGVCLTDDGDVTLMTNDPRVNAGILLDDVQIMPPDWKPEQMRDA